jgi:predicted regulator of amino acid metabolism with ACT domain
MWNKLQDKFRNSPSQLMVINKLIQSGLSVVRDYENVPRIYCSDVEIKPNSLANAMGIDRRVVLEALRKISDDVDLYSFFSSLKPMANLGGADYLANFGRIQVIPEEANRPGIIAGILSVIASHGINVRQVIVDDPEMVKDPKALVITEKTIPAELLPELRKVAGVRAIVIL